MNVHIDSVNKSLGQDDGKIGVLKDVSCTIDESETCTIIGMDDSDKSTLLNCLNGLDRPNSGMVLVGDREIISLSCKDLGRCRRDLVSFVSRFYNLVPTLTVRESVGVCGHLSSDPMPLNDLLTDLGLADHHNKFLSQLSDGWQQHRAIACASIKRSRPLLCDGPIGAFDYEANKEMLSLPERINHDLDTTTVIVTHNQVLAEVAHCIITVHDDRISDAEVREDPTLASSLIQ